MKNEFPPSFGLKKYYKIVDISLKLVKLCFGMLVRNKAFVALVFVVVFYCHPSVITRVAIRFDPVRWAAENQLVEYIAASYLNCK